MQILGLEDEEALQIGCRMSQLVLLSVMIIADASLWLIPENLSLPFPVLPLPMGMKLLVPSRPLLPQSE